MTPKREEPIAQENFEKVDPVNCSSNLDDEKKNETNAEDKSEDSPNGKKTVGRGVAGVARGEMVVGVRVGAGVVVVH